MIDDSKYPKWTSAGDATPRPHFNELKKQLLETMAMLDRIPKPERIAAWVFSARAAANLPRAENPELIDPLQRLCAVPVLIWRNAEELREIMNHRDAAQFGYVHTNEGERFVIEAENAGRRMLCFRDSFTT